MQGEITHLQIKLGCVCLKTSLGIYYKQDKTEKKPMYVMRPKEI